MVSNNAPEQLLIALEPEAASIHCREMKMREFATSLLDLGQNTLLLISEV